MVNLDKWEKIDYRDIKEGDKLLVEAVENRFEDKDKDKVLEGVTLKGTAKLGHNSMWYLGHWRIVSVNAFDVKIYRKRLRVEERDAKFEFPDGIGAIIQGDCAYGDDRKLVYNGAMWHLSGATRPIGRTTEEVRERYQNFRLISEGVK